MNDHSNIPKVEQGATPMECDTPNNTPSNADDDPVVHEIPVFLAKSLAKQLFLYQVRK